VPAFPSAPTLNCFALRFSAALRRRVKSTLGAASNLPHHRLFAAEAQRSGHVTKGRWHRCPLSLRNAIQRVLNTNRSDLELAFIQLQDDPVVIMSLWVDAFAQI